MKAVTKERFEEIRANAMLEATADVSIAGGTWAEMEAASAAAKARIEADYRIEAGAAEYEFRLFCEEGPGARVADVLAGMGVENDGSPAFWKRAAAAARLSRAAWLRA